MKGAHFERDGWSCLLVEIVIKRFDHCPCWEDDGIGGSKKILNSKNINLEYLVCRKIARAFKFKTKWPYFQKSITRSQDDLEIFSRD